jgi:hypothetical protein
MIKVPLQPCRYGLHEPFLLNIGTLTMKGFKRLERGACGYLGAKGTYGCTGMCGTQ